MRLIRQGWLLAALVPTFFVGVTAGYSAPGLRALSALNAAQAPPALPVPPVLPAQTVTFTKDVAPLIFAHCVTCHRPGEIGPFSLMTYADARQHATQIADVTAERLMPPWKPVLHARGTFIGERALTDAQIDIFKRWVDGGATEGDAADLPPAPPATSGWQLGTPDLVVTMPVPYTVGADGPDVFRTFVVPVPSIGMKYVRALEFSPGNTRVVHHANLGVDRGRVSRRMDDADPLPGYAGGIMPDASYPVGYMLGWTPGQRARPSPDGMAWVLESGSDLVVQMHLRPTGRPEPVQFSAAFYFTDQPPARQPIGLRIGSETFEVSAGDPVFLMSDAYVLPVDVSVLAVQPHAHNLGKRMEAWATLPGGATRPLIAIDNWDFRWQDVYRFTEPVALPKGTTISMQYQYDNSAANPRNPQNPPVRVMWGQNTSDEMGDLWLQVTTRELADAAVLGNDIGLRMLEQDLAAYTKLLVANPKDPVRHDTVAMLQLRVGNIEYAVEEFRESLKLNNDSAATHYNLGTALTAQRKFTEALVEFSEAIRIDPNYAEARNNYGAMFHILGRLEDAATQYQRAIALNPGNAEAHENLGRAYVGLGRWADGLGQFRAALQLRPAWIQPMVGAAWILASGAEEGLRRPEEAVQLAERAVQLTGRRDPTALDALAAAYASTGRFPLAADTARAAAVLAGPQLAADIRSRAALYAQGTPYLFTR